MAPPPNPRDPDELVAAVGLTEKAGTRVRQLSGGQRRRLDVALGIVGRPELLFLDEPTTGFDPEARRSFCDLLLDLRDEGTTILLTTRGGAYGAGTPREGWDHNTDFLRRILVDIWGADLTVVEREFTLVGVNPMLDEFAEVAALMHKTADEAASDAGTALASRRAA